MENLVRGVSETKLKTFLPPEPKVYPVIDSDFWEEMIVIMFDNSKKT